MTKADIDALKRAMAITAAEDEGRAEQLADMLKERPWTEVARFAAYCAQTRALSLKLHESPPMEADIGPASAENRQARRLLK